MTSDKEHTPTPWKQMETIDGVKGLVILGADGIPVGNAWSDSRPECRENAEFIVKSVNSYEESRAVIEELLEAAKEATLQHDGGSLMGCESCGACQLEKVVAKAEKLMGGENGRS
jgi:hypothetical protein